MKFDLAMENYGMDYYMWDAGKPYWDGYAGKLPVKDGEQASQEASGTDRYFNSNKAQFHAVNACKVCPNANEAALYVFRGDPHWDETTLWVKNKHLYKGGMWFLKQAKITGFRADQAYDGTDWCTNGNSNSWSVSQTLPDAADAGNYFYLPALGYYTSGQLYYVGDIGYYWSSSAYPGYSNYAYYLYFISGSVGVRNYGRNSGSRAEALQ